MQHSITDHAKIRAQQRGIRQHAVEFILRHADRVAPAKKERVLIYCSRNHLSSFKDVGLPEDLTKQIARATLVFDPASRMVITVLTNEPFGQRYRFNRRIAPTAMNDNDQTSAWPLVAA